jgi:His/Glu/Gln/Arg/opine family amino acid ABC transporter permease subunit
METNVFLYGFGPVLLAGTIQTIELSVLSLAAAVLLGLAGAAAKLSFNRPLRALGTAYTTLIRSVPDLVLMLLLFYSIQIAVNDLTDALNLPQFDINPFVAGVITLGFIYGAYFTETFRGAFLAVPRGQLEAGAAYGPHPVSADDAFRAARHWQQLAGAGEGDRAGIDHRSRGRRQGRPGRRQEHLQHVLLHSDRRADLPCHHHGVESRADLAGEALFDWRAARRALREKTR